MAVIGSTLWSYVILAALMALTGFSVVLLTYSVDKNRRMTAVALTEVISYLREVEEKQEMILELLEHLQGDMEQRCTHTPTGHSKDIAGFDRKYLRFAIKLGKKTLLWAIPFASTAIEVVHDVLQLLV